MTERFIQLMEQLRSLKDERDCAEMAVVAHLRTPGYSEEGAQMLQRAFARISGQLDGVLAIALIEFDRAKQMRPTCRVRRCLLDVGHVGAHSFGEVLPANTWGDSVRCTAVADHEATLA